ncbi:MAG: glutamate-5-semialdehyde dehydrogenase [Alphaproteobacteria bacterium]|nr:glutamate-5-semialdehyde dehydrogenase [Alphaproteobacteria bacterium]
MDSPSHIIEQLGKETKQASRVLANTSIPTIHDILSSLAEELHHRTDDILKANQKDIEAAKTNNLSPALIDRLTLTPERIENMAEGIRAIIALDDPVGHVLEETTRPNGLLIQKMSVPIGVLGMIYESRPNVTIDAASLCLKSRNAVILRGGSDSFHTSRLLHNLVQDALDRHGLPRATVSMLPSTDRALVGEMLKAHKYIDVMIPRGGKGLTSRVMREATMPVFAHLDGNCHIYVHDSAKPELALNVIQNAKLRRTGICGAAESLLFDEKISDETARNIIQMLLEQNCAVVGDEKTQELDPRVTVATEEDWVTEYLEAKISCKYIADTAEAIAHINTHGSHHTDAILAEDEQAVDQFLTQVDSAIVMHNSSTQFADGGEFGMGAEIGISTGKLHARGPVGLKQLTTYKYVVKGSGQTRPV